MKRLSYISRLVSEAPERDLQEIQRVSQRNNARDGITGVLLYIGGYFFQLIEGEDEAIDRLFDKLQRDARHTDIVLIQTELGVTERLFPQWAMEVFNLERREEDYLLPLRLLLQTLFQSHQIIARYTQPTVAHMLARGLNPGQIKPRRIERVVLFGDILGFTTLTEALGEAEVLGLVERYLDLCTEQIEGHGGEVNKFIGDSVMGYFPAERLDAALESVLEILKALNEMRASAPVDSPLRLLYTGFGLAYGPVLEGNVGTGRKLDYTLLGDTVNTAARLQALTREIGYQILLAAEVRDHVQQAWTFKSLGQYAIRGKETPVELFTLDDPRACCLIAPDSWRTALKTFLAAQAAQRPV